MSRKPTKKTDRNKSWKRRTESKKRISKGLGLRNLFRIYCEGTKTEPEYFRSFDTNRVTTRVFIEGLGMSKLALVEKVVKKLQKGKYLKGQQELEKRKPNKPYLPSQF